MLKRIVPIALVSIALITVGFDAFWFGYERGQSTEPTVWQYDFYGQALTLTGSATADQVSVDATNATIKFMSDIKKQLIAPPINAHNPEIVSYNITQVTSGVLYFSVVYRYKKTQSLIPSLVLSRHPIDAVVSVGPNH